MTNLLTRDLDETYDAYRQRLTALDNEQAAGDRITYQRLYEELSIVDNKVGALVQLVSIQAAIYALIISPSVGDSPFKDGWSAYDVALLIGAVATYFSLFLCISVLWLTWSGPAIEARRQVWAERLFRIRRERTIRYRASWLLAFAGSALLAVYLVASSLSQIKTG